MQGDGGDACVAGFVNRHLHGKRAGHLSKGPAGVNCCHHRGLVGDGGGGVAQRLAPFHRAQILHCAHDAVGVVAGQVGGDERSGHRLGDAGRDTRSLKDTAYKIRENGNWDRFHC